MALVWIPKEDEWALTTALDAGAAGIIIHHNESKAEIEEFIKNFITAAPLGNRSFSPWVFTPGISDASLYPDDAFNIKTANNYIAVIPQIESVKGVANVEEIALISGVSTLMFGPGDFMADAGVPLSLGEPHPTLVSAMESMSKASKSSTSHSGESGSRAIMFLDVWSIDNMVKSIIEKAKGLFAIQMILQ
ncbi:hypothetical protein MKX08_007230 [Trichoderma sp. CBMAI-0020]|nr:hypothetical protein MKX08_007230 [Trichoderma sp. CBMAI-0020]